MVELMGGRELWCWWEERSSGGVDERKGVVVVLMRGRE